MKYLSVIAIFLIISNTIFGTTACDTSQRGDSADCPYFQCNSTTGVQGQIDRTITPTIARFFKDISGSNINQDSQCVKFCRLYYPTCQFWTRAQYDATNGACLLFRASACDAPKSFLPNSTLCEPIAATPGVTVDASFTSGQVCSDPSQAPSPPPPVGVVGDPHYTGADNSHFDFTGEPGKSYCMLSDSHLHINVYHGGRYGVWGKNPHKALTWIRQIVVFWGHNQFKFVARQGADWQYGNGYMGRMEFNNHEVHLPQVGTSASLVGGQATISWVSAMVRSGDDDIDIYELKIDGILTLVMRLRPEIPLLRVPEDGTVHFGIEIPFIQVTPNVHGILGQTFRGDHSDRLSKQKLKFDDHLNVDIVPGENAEGFLDGSKENYESSELNRPDCGFSRFVRATKPDPESSLAVEKSSAGVQQQSFVDKE